VKRLVAAALLAALILAGCGGGSTSPGASPSATSGATLVVARVKDAVGLDPAHETDGLSLNVTSEVFENLVKFKPGTFEVIPDLAQSWKAAPDGKTWTFTLKPGRKFSDGFCRVKPEFPDH
jgi:peptide/nickel transport system substrate-binding protein